MRLNGRRDDGPDEILRGGMIFCRPRGYFLAGSNQLFHSCDVSTYLKDHLLHFHDRDTFLIEI